MGNILVPGQYSGRNYGFTIAGDAPTVDEQRKMDGYLRQYEQDFFQEYEATTGRAVDTGEGSGILNYLGELPKGIARGGLGMLEDATIAAAEALAPAQYDDWAREQAMKLGQWSMKGVQPDIGYEDTIIGNLGQGLGSFAPLMAASMIPGVGVPAALGLSALAGTGRVSESARSVGELATSEDKLKGAAVGLSNMIPIGLSKWMGLTKATGLWNRVGRILATGGEEAAQEAVENTMMNAIQQGYDPEQELFAGAASDAAYGGAVGAIMQSAIETLGSRRVRLDNRAKERAQAAAEAAGPPLEGMPSAMVDPTGATTLPDLGGVTVPPEWAAPAAGLPTVSGPVGAAAVEAPTAEAELVKALETRTGPARGIDAAIAGATATAAKEMPKLGGEYLQIASPELSVPEAMVLGSPEYSALSEVKQRAEAYYKLSSTLGVVERIERLAAYGSSPAEIVADLDTLLKGVDDAAATNNTDPQQLKLSVVRATLRKLGMPNPKAQREAWMDLAKERVAARETAVAATSTAAVPTDRQVARQEAAREAATVEAALVRANDPKTMDLPGVGQLPSKEPAATKGMDAALQTRLDEDAEVAVADDLDATMVATLQSDIQQADGPEAEEYFRTRVQDLRAGEEQTRTATENAEKRVEDNVSEPGAGGPMEARGAADVDEAGAGEGVADRKRVVERVAEPEAEDVTQPVVSGEVVPESPDVGAAGEPTPLEIEATAQQYNALGSRRGAPDPAVARVFRGVRGDPRGFTGEGSRLTPGSLLDAQLARPDAEQEVATSLVEQRENRALADTIKSNFENVLDDATYDYITTNLGTDENIPDITSAADKQAILALRAMTNEKKKTHGGLARYFEKFPTVMEALQVIAYDAGVMTEAYKRPHVALTPKVLADLNKYPAAKATVDAIRANVLASGDEQIVEGGPEFNRKVAAALMEEEAQHRFYELTGGVHAKRALAWVRENLSKKAVDGVNDMHQNFLLDSNVLEANIDSRAAQQEAQKDNQAAVDKYYADLAKEDTKAALHKDTERRFPQKFDDGVYSVRLPLDIRTAASNNNLPRVMSFVAGFHPSEHGRRMAKAFIPHLGGTKIQALFPGDAGFDAHLGQLDRRPDRGSFVPSTNTISLNSESGMTIEVVLHEVAHALTSHTLENASHPLTKQMTSLFDEASSSIAGAYGATDVHEFAAEAASNEDFRQLLAAIEIGKGPARVSVLAKYKQIVGNFIRRLMGLAAKPDIAPHTGDALTAVDRLIEQILAPHPGSIGDGELYHLQRLSKVDSEAFLNRMATNAAEWKPQHADGFFKMLGDYVPDWVKSSALRFLEAGPLAEISQRFMPSVTRFNDLVREQTGRLHIMNQRMEPIIKNVSDFAKDNTKQQYQTLISLMNESTLYETDPSLTDVAARKKYGKDPDKWKAYLRVRQMYVAVGKPGQDIYGKVRNIYLDMNTQTREAIKGRFASLIEDTGTRKTVTEKLFSEIMDKGMIDPYFSLMRTGDFWVQYNGVDPTTGTNETYIETFQTDRQRRTAVRRLHEIGATEIHSLPSKGKVDFTKVPPNSFVYGVLRTLDTHMPGTKEGSDAKSEILDLFLRNMPESSFLQGYNKRKGTLGFAGGVTPLTEGQEPINFAKLLYNKTMSMTHQIATIEFNAKYDALSRDLEAERISPDLQVDPRERSAVDRLHKEIERRIEFAKSPNIHAFAKSLRMGAFHWTIGGLNPSSSMVNMMQLPGVVTPFLAADYGMKPSVSQMKESSELFWNSRRGGMKWVREVETYSSRRDADGNPIMESVEMAAGPSLDNIDFGAGGIPKRVAARKYLVDVATELGQLHRTIAYDTLDMHYEDDMLSKANAVSGFLFHHTERANRQITMDAAYMLAYDRKQKEVQEKYGRDVTEAEARAMAYDALALTDRTNGSVAAASAPSIAQNDIGAVLYMFKRFGGAMYWHMGKMLHDSLRAVDTTNMNAEQLEQHKQMRRLAGYQFASTFGTTAAMAGVQGLPGFGMLALIYNLLWGDDEDETLEELTRRNMGEGWYKGLVNTVFGVEVASRVGLNNLIFRPALYEKDQSLLWTAAEQLGGPVIGVTVNALRGMEEMGDEHGDKWLAAEAMVPATMRNLSKSLRFATRGVVTRRGDTIIDDLSVGHLFGQAFGFAPAEYIEAMELNAGLKRMDNEVRDLRSGITKRLYMAQRNNDAKGVRDALDDLREYNERYPEWQLTPESVMRSLKTHADTTAEMFQGIALNPKLMPRWMEIASEW